MKLKLTPPQIAEISKLSFVVSEQIKDYTESRSLAPRTNIIVEISLKETKDLKLWAVNKLIELQQTFKIMDATRRLEAKHKIQSIMNLIKKLS